MVGHKSLMTSPPARVPNARHVAISIELRTDRTLPSPITKFTSGVEVGAERTTLSCSMNGRIWNVPPRFPFELFTKRTLPSASAMLLPLVWLDAPAGTARPRLNSPTAAAANHRHGRRGDRRIDAFVPS